MIAFTGGICGANLMCIIPSMMVLKARQMSPVDHLKNPYRSFFKNTIWIYVMLIFGSTLIIYTLYSNIWSDNIKCYQTFGSIPEVNVTIVID